MSASLKINLIPKVLELEVNSALIQRPSESFTQTYTANLYGKLAEYKKESSTPFERHVVTEIGFAGLVIFGALEALAWGVATLFLKTLASFSDNPEQFDEPTLQAKINLIGSWVTTHTSALALIDNLNDAPLDGLLLKTMASYTRLEVEFGGLKWGAYCG